MTRALRWKWRIINWLNKKWPDPTPEQSLENDAKLVKEFVEDKKNEIQAKTIAEGLKRDFPHWFTIKQVVRKYHVEPNGVVAQLQMLGLFKLCTSRENTKGEASFKILLDDSDRLLVMQIQFDEHMDQANALDKEMKRIEAKLLGEALERPQQNKD